MKVNYLLNRINYTLRCKFLLQRNKSLLCKLSSNYYYFKKDTALVIFHIKHYLVCFKEPLNSSKNFKHSDRLPTFSYNLLGEKVGARTFENIAFLIYFRCGILGKNIVSHIDGHKLCLLKKLITSQKGLNRI